MSENFGKSLRRLRGERSQREVAAALGIPTTTLSSLEQQDTVPRGPMLQRLIDHFGVSSEYFFPAKASNEAREWIRGARHRQFDGATVVATHATHEFTQEEKERFAEQLRARIAKP